MPLDSLKITVNISKLIDSLNKQKTKENSKYEKDLINYEDYLKKQSIKISNEIRKISDQVKELNFDSITTSYRNKIQFELHTSLNKKPNKPDHKRIDRVMRALILSDDESITMKQSEYDRLFEGL